MGTGQTYFTFGTGTKYNEVTIRGTGKARASSTAFHNTTEPEVPSNYGTVDTLIIEPTIDELESGVVIWGSESALSKSFQIKTIVIQRPADQSLTLNSGWIPSGKSNTNPKPTFDIYADHPAVGAYSYSSNITVNIHPLSEWGG